MLVNGVTVDDAYNAVCRFPSESIHMCVGSPPYWALRNYNVPSTDWPEVNFRLNEWSPIITVPSMTCCLGLEESPVAYVAHLVLIYREIRRTLRKDGTCWINIGDSYASAQKNRTIYQVTQSSTLNESKARIQSATQQRKNVGGLKKKDLVGIPWMLALALRADGWYLRQDIIWHKPNPMPESVTDRCTKAHEYIFLFTKSKRYYYDANSISEDAKRPFDTQIIGGQKAINNDINAGDPRFRNGHEQWGREITVSEKVNKRSVWSITTKPYKGAHFATFPPEIPEYAIKAGTSEFGCCADCGAPLKRAFKKSLIATSKASHNSEVDERDLQADARDAGSNRMKDGHKPGMVNTYETTGWFKTCRCETAATKPAIVLDPFMGSGTTAIVAEDLGRHWAGIEVSQKYADEELRPRIETSRLKHGLFKVYPYTLCL